MKSRALYIGLGLGVATFVVILLSIGLPKGSFIAKLLLDKGTYSAVPYPITFQNLMWLLLGAGIGDVAFRYVVSDTEEAVRRLGLLPENPHDVLVPTDMAGIRDKLGAQASIQDSFLVRLLDQCTLHFGANRSPGETRDMMSTMVDLELHDVELRYTLLRYLTWLIPTFGFIGTVVGLARALGHMEADTAGQSISESLGPVIDSLGLAFNTTILALSFSAVLVLLMQMAQRKEEGAANGNSVYCLKNFVNRLHVPPSNY